MKLAVGADQGKDRSVRITISCQNKDDFANNNMWKLLFVCYFIHSEGTRQKLLFVCYLVHSEGTGQKLLCVCYLVRSEGTRQKLFFVCYIVHSEGTRQKLLFVCSVKYIYILHSSRMALAVFLPLL